MVLADEAQILETHEVFADWSNGRMLVAYSDDASVETLARLETLAVSMGYTDTLEQYWDAGWERTVVIFGEPHA